MQRLSITIDDDLLAEVDELVEARGYASRSEAIRDALRDALTRNTAPAHSVEHVYGVLSYVFEHDLRDLAKRLTSQQHDHHDLSVSTLHVHISGKDCLEVAILKGEKSHVQAYADSIATQRGVRYANLHLVPVDH